MANIVGVQVRPKELVVQIIQSLVKNIAISNDKWYHESI